VNRRSVKKSSLFLMELTVAVLFFSICAAVCMRVFAAAKTNADYSRNLTNASIKAQSAAEGYKHSAGRLDAVAEILGGSVEGNRVTVLYGPDWNRASDGESAAFILTLDQTDSGVYLKSALVTVVKAGETERLFSITAETAGD
jgi:uncharacterized protein (DUF2147 family)